MVNRYKSLETYKRIWRRHLATKANIFFGGAFTRCPKHLNATFYHPSFNFNSENFSKVPHSNQLKSFHMAKTWKNSCLYTLIDVSFWICLTYIGMKFVAMAYGFPVHLHGYRNEGSLRSYHGGTTVFGLPVILEYLTDSSKLFFCEVVPNRRAC